MSKILQVKNLVKNYDNLKAIKGVSLSVAEGEIVGLLGPNGAGKTTTIGMILGILKPTGGSIQVLGKDLVGHRAELAAKMNFSAVYAQIPANLTVTQNLYVFGMIYNIKNLKSKIKELIEEFDLQKYATTKAGWLSSGELSRLNLAKALINQPDLLLLDEPTASLDPDIAADIRTKIKNYVKENQAGVLWTSHNMYEIAMVCDRVLFLSHGKILLEGDPRTLPAKYGKKDLEELFISVAREPLTFEKK